MSKNAITFNQRDIKAEARILGERAKNFNFLTVYKADEGYKNKIGLQVKKGRYLFGN